MLDEFPIFATLLGDPVHCERKPEPWPDDLMPLISPEDIDAARREITSWPGYEPTPVHNLDKLASDLHLGNIFYKDEGPRFGLGAFKALGGAYAIKQVCKLHGTDITVTSATAGNHGRSLAWGAKNTGCKCRIVIHAGVSDERKQAMEAFGAVVDRIDGNYDQSVEIAARDAEQNGWHLISDTSWPGYTEPCRQIMIGYTLIVEEIIDQLSPDDFPSHVFVQGGVGGLAGAICAGFWIRSGNKMPRIVVVEPALAACLTESARSGKPVEVNIHEETSMSGLSCGKVSMIAWDILSRGASDFLTVAETGVAPAVRLLASGNAGGDPIIAGESGVAGLIALIAAAKDAGLRRALGLSETSRILLIGSEGATDAAAYARIMAGGKGKKNND
jgi:diaminopropionate ammonia-lyase